VALPDDLLFASYVSRCFALEDAHAMCGKPQLLRSANEFHLFGEVGL
jgi:hypothetical protein